MRFLVNKYLCIMAVLALLILSCDSEESSSYDLTVKWNIGNVPVCKSFLNDTKFSQSEVAFDKVEIQIFSDKEMTKSIQAPVDVPCELYEYKFTRLESDKYYVRVDGYADYEGQELAFFTGNTRVSIPADDDEVAISLELGTGEVEVFWGFESNLTCGLEKAGEVEHIVVSLEQDEKKVSCGEGQVLFTDMQPGEEYQLTAVALDEDGNVLEESVVSGGPISVLPGEVLAAELTF